MRSGPNRTVKALGALALLAAAPPAAHAGMPMWTLTDVAGVRLTAISFFLVLWLASARGVRRLWNGLRQDWPSLPELGFRRAAALVTLWGLAFVVVLTMISGARELMTPGAWRKEGALYKLSALAPEENARRERLDALRAELWRWSAAHGGRLPPDDLDAGIPEDAWKTLDAAGSRFVYAAGARAGAGREPVAYEPSVYGEKRFVLRSDGAIVLMSREELRQALAGGGR